MECRDASYHLAEKNIEYYINAINEYRLIYLWGYSSSLTTIAQTIIKKGIKPPKLKVIISNAEPLFQYQRELISKAFKCPVRNTYGMSEMVAAASECNFGVLHLWPAVGIVEILKDDSDETVKPGETGRIICTGLLNNEMPLIRYEVGDRGSLIPQNSPCKCGRSLPQLKSIEGRCDDVIITKEGRKIGRLDPIFKTDIPIKEAQIIQETYSTIVLRIVPADGFNNNSKKRLLSRMQERVGNMSILIELVDKIPRSANGKFRAVLSQLSSNIK
jgi:phenylacetate-CoA ligase